MKMVKSLLLGTAAGLLAVAGAQAADMPVKAKPVEYVKICSLYGAGFYYIPGTDTCLKIGGYVRVQTESKAGASGQNYGTGGVLGSARYDRADSNDINWTVRGVMSLDARTQTDYGTLRSYIRAGWNQSTPGVSGAGTTPCATVANNCLGYWDRAFIQFAGFTVGRAQSFFDLFTYGGAYTYLNVRTSGDTGAAGVDLWAYTVQFGNGVSYTLSLEDPLAHNKFGTVDNNLANFFAFPGAVLADNGLVGQAVTNNGFRVPDIITNLRIDQAWGYLGISTAIHDASGAYYSTAVASACGAAGANNVNCGHPGDKYGWAVAVGGLLNLPGNDIVGVNYVYAKGAPGYAFNSGPWSSFRNSNSLGIAFTADGVFGNGSQVELTEAWSLNAGYQHIWGPAGTWGGKWRTTLYGGYVSVNYNDAATALINAGLGATATTGGVCNGGVNVGATTFTGFAPLAGNSCSPDFSFYQVGSRTQFNPHPLMDIGLDVFYTKLNSAYKGPVNWAATGARPACTNSAILACNVEDQGIWSAIVRWQRNFYP